MPPYADDFTHSRSMSEGIPTYLDVSMKKKGTPNSNPEAEEKFPTDAQYDRPTMR